jgi:hypothetical protein
MENDCFINNERHELRPSWIRYELRPKTCSQNSKYARSVRRECNRMYYVRWRLTERMGEK